MRTNNSKHQVRVPKNVRINHRFVQLPQEFKRMRVVSLLITLVTTIVLQLSSFCMQVGKSLVAADYVKWGLFFIALHFCSTALTNTLRLWFDEIRTSHDEAFQKTSQKIVGKILLTVQGHVFKDEKNNGIICKMKNRPLLDSAKNYITMAWRFQMMLPSRILEFLVLVGMFIGFCVVSKFEIENAWIFIIVIVIEAVAAFFFSNKRRKVYREASKDIKEKKQKNDVVVDDILNTEPVIEEHSEMMIGRVEEASTKLFKAGRNRRLSNNRLNTKECFVNALAVVVCVVLKYYECPNMNSDDLLGVISVLTIFTKIISEIKEFFDKLEMLDYQIQDMRTYYEDCKLILETYDEEVSRQVSKGRPAEIEAMVIQKSQVSYPTKGNSLPYVLDIERMELVPGDFVFLTGPTGAGKTTLMDAIVGNVRFPEFNVDYKYKKDGDIKPVMYRTNAKMGSGSAMSELIFDEDGLNFDETKLKGILDGVHATEFLEKVSPDDIFEYLRNASYGDFSNGQCQRLLLARMLYHLKPENSVVIFDEATSGINDEICLDVLEYIKEFCKDKIVIMASHQRRIVEKVCNKRLEIVEETNYRTSLTEV